MKRPVIGVVPLVDEERESYWMLPGYMKGIEEAGGLPVMLHLTADEKMIKEIANMADGFLFTGGHDVSPALYGAERSERCGAVCPERDAMEGLLLKYALQKDASVLGICRGIQFLNAYFGGTLYQDLPTEYASKIEHHMTPPYDRRAHYVDVVPGTPLFELLRERSLGVNSYHHQAVKTLAPQLEAMAYSEDGLVEAVYLPEKRFVWAVQWHPEFSYRNDEASRKIFAAFVASIR
ncbi:MAG: gamma-glutamyl-gamma-aminobutyrate hydrolase family protein [Clostridia bacterium]|nr:gamma-glutamyl-gamma-aminobutyrate hydrolase family protein [Clostridia bacterium]